MPRSRVLLGLAAACGLVHAASSLSWALGSRWLLDTVGRWATDWVDRAPTTAALALLAITAVKVTAAVLPLTLARGRRRWTPALRAVSWVGAVGLAVYGTANTVGAWLVLAGVVDDGAGPDRAALVGHAVLWDPLFAAWGVLLALGLRDLGRVHRADYDGTVNPRNLTGRRTTKPSCS